MPIYEYKCAKCGTKFEHLSRNAKDLPDRCPECQGRSIKKVLSAFSVSSGSSRDESACCSTCPGAGEECSEKGCPRFA